MSKKMHILGLYLSTSCRISTRATPSNFLCGKCGRGTPSTGSSYELLVVVVAVVVVGVARRVLASSQ